MKECVARRGGRKEVVEVKRNDNRGKAGISATRRPVYACWKRG